MCKDICVGVRARGAEMRVAALSLLLLLTTACAGTSGDVNLNIDKDTGQDFSTPTPDARSTTEIEETAAPREDLPNLPEVVADSAIVPQCDPGEGCFLDGCSGNEGCRSGWCVEHIGEGVCSELRQEECPDGWTCKQVAGTDPDVVYICVSNYANLCRPCAEADDCAGTVGTEDACVAYGEGEQFCGGACDADAGGSGNCPWGFSCADVLTMDGVELKQCVNDAGVCPCTDTSVALGLWTPCEVISEAGICYGKRVCAETGLSECDAAIPAAESCNGLDDDCDGETDEPLLVEGEYANLCDDDNDCTDDACKSEGGCEHIALSEGECIDGDACTVGDHCEDGECLGLPIACDDTNPCTDDVCDGLGGCAAEFNSDECDDNDPCTVSDTCKEGACVGFPVDCDCMADQDCADLDDGNACNGTLFCDQGKLPYWCAVEPDTEIFCPGPAEGPDAICLAAACDAETGACSLVPAHEGFACDDGNECTVGDQCAAGTCVAGVPALCNDGNACTSDGCAPESGCIYENNLNVCDDGDVCTTGDVCLDSECGGPGVLDCDDENECTDDACDPGVGCVHTAHAGWCSDDNACTAGDHCEGGKCLFAEGVQCDDANSCTKDSCLPAIGCQQVIVAGPCDDGDPCTFEDQCVNGECVGGGMVVCNDGNPCTDDQCGPLGECIHNANAGGCDDGDACTTGDHCEDTICTHDQVLECDDGNLCTDDECDPLEGCVFHTNTLPCDDGSVCTTSDHCELGECVSGGELACDDNNLCTDDSCDPAVGCVFQANTLPCDDGNECTAVDVCADGSCLGTDPPTCDDGNLCTTDSCDPGQGCIFSTNSVPCNDGNTCTTNDICADGACDGTGLLNCNDGNLCTDDGCDPQDGCVFTANSIPCDDGNACTQIDACTNGTCKGTDLLDCDDQNLCTTDLCDLAEGCVHVDNAFACDDADPCTVGDGCSAGVCAPGAPMVCDDGNGCTDDSCVAFQGCLYEHSVAPCDDGNACTDNDVCGGGQCDGDAITCDDNDKCTTNTCNPDVGCAYAPITPCCGKGVVEGGESCDDGNNNNNDGCKNDCSSPPQQCSQVAIAHCQAKGWQHVGGGSGNIVCTKNGQSTGHNCDQCDKYHIYVWVNGSKELHCPDHNYSTVAGNFYSAHTPCVCGDNLDLCGSWNMGGCTPD